MTPLSLVLMGVAICLLLGFVLLQFPAPKRRGEVNGEQAQDIIQRLVIDLNAVYDPGDAAQENGAIRWKEGNLALTLFMRRPILRVRCPSARLNHLVVVQSVDHEATTSLPPVGTCLDCFGQESKSDTLRRWSAPPATLAWAFGVYGDDFKCFPEFLTPDISATIAALSERFVLDLRGKDCGEHYLLTVHADTVTIRTQLYGGFLTDPEVFLGLAMPVVRRAFEVLKC